MYIVIRDIISPINKRNNTNIQENVRNHSQYSKAYTMGSIVSRFEVWVKV